VRTPHKRKENKHADTGTRTTIPVPVRVPYRALTYLAASEYGIDLHCSQYQPFAAELASHTPRKSNER
jgi:hypothetical protein